jgi:non-specific serine/threonine protein kinase
LLLGRLIGNWVNCRQPMTDDDPVRTRHDGGSAVVSELRAVGFDDAEEIGRGGFGIVYRCTQPALDRTVAVKVLIAGVDEDVDRQRFLREQRVMGRLTGHPNIVVVLQTGQTASGHPYLVMQYHRRGSLDARLRRAGPLPLDEALRLAVKMAGALETAHRVGILHRDIKPGNILYTEYGEPALSDFGIARMSDEFKTVSGTILGSPAFTAPEILSGDPPSRTADVYGLGGTLFCALTGHAPFERRSGEQMVAQVLRITTERAPDLRDSGIPDDVAAAVERAMSRNPHDRPSAVEWGQEIQQLQARYGFPVDDMALRAEAAPDQRAGRAITWPGYRRTLANLPAELTSFVGRRDELAELKKLLAHYRLVTVSGIGGVGKTRLALRAAAETADDFPDGVRLIELGELRDGALLVDVVAAGVGLRGDAATPLVEVLVAFLCSGHMLLVLDNCEQLVDAVAELAETLLRGCPQVRILATSRESLGVLGEAVLPLAPLAVPDTLDPTLEGLHTYDAVALFAERAAAAVPGFALTKANKATVTQICGRLDGLPLAIELAAARLRAMSPEQILQRLADRYAVLAHGSRRAPTRQQTLRLSVEWSYDLCTPAEQQLWGRLSVFAATLDLEAAEHVCGNQLDSQDLVELVTSLVDKSILTRTESKGVVRFRLLDTLRAYGHERIAQTDEYVALQRRHCDWYWRLADEAAAEWFSPTQIGWIQRLDWEMSNLREAMEFSLTHSPGATLQMAVDLSPFWIAHGLIGEGRRWLDRALAATAEEPTLQRICALYYASGLAGLQGDLPNATAHSLRAQALVEHNTDPAALALVAVNDGFITLLRGDPDRACQRLETAVDDCNDLSSRAAALLLLSWAHELRGNMVEALAYDEKVLALAELHGESVFRSMASWSIGLENWRQGDHAEAAKMLKRGLRLAQHLNDARTAASCLEVLAWIAAEDGQPVRAAVMMSAADTIGRTVGNWAFVFPDRRVFHEGFADRVRAALTAEGYQAAAAEGRSMSLNDAAAHALAE